MPKLAPTRQELEAAIPVIYHEMGQMFSYFFWWKARPILIGNPHFQEPGMPLSSIQNAAVIASLLAIRKLNEFFKDRPPRNDERNDDLRAYDYSGFAETGEVLRPEDYKEIHKRIAHMTFQAVNNGQASYELYMAVGLMLPRCVRFLEYIRNTFYVGQPDKIEEIQIIQDGLIRIRQHWERDVAVENGGTR
ncbi:MAG: hypothetical protein JWR19_4510 [Pedosphaera sp.]|nr:hypothetical protein [Pedosphaera sp.]